MSKPRNTSKSGNSAKSTRRRGPSAPASPSSPTAPVSFETVFGKAEDPTSQGLREQLREAQERLQAHKSSPPTATAPRLFKTLHRQRQQRLERAVRDLQEAVDWITAKNST